MLRKGPVSETWRGDSFGEEEVEALWLPSTQILFFGERARVRMGKFLGEAGNPSEKFGWTVVIMEGRCA